MPPTDKYREQADACVRLAETAPEEERLVLLKMAQAWRRLAESAERIKELEKEAADGGFSSSVFLRRIKSRISRSSPSFCNFPSPARVDACGFGRRTKRVRECAV